MSDDKLPLTPGDALARLYALQTERPFFTRSFEPDQDIAERSPQSAELLASPSLPFQPAPSTLDSVQSGQANGAATINYRQNSGGRKRQKVSDKSSPDGPLQFDCAENYHFSNDALASIFDYDDDATNQTVPENVDRKCRTGSTGDRYRPHMLSIFKGLQLSEAEYVRMQVAARDFMLDSKHKDRFESVGQRVGRNRKQSDLAKLKLITCAEEFMTAEGWGERMYGQNSKKSEVKTMKWPESRLEIITNTIPLLRRMVTNERQRLYNYSQRRGNKKSKGTSLAGSSDTDSPSTLQSPQPPKNNTHISSDPFQFEDSIGMQPAATSLSHMSPVQYQSNETADASFQAITDGTTNIDNTDDGRYDYLFTSLHGLPPGDLFNPTILDGTELIYHVNLMNNGIRYAPKLFLDRFSCPNYESLVQSIKSKITDENHNLAKIMVHSPTGLVEVDGQDTWNEAVDLIKDCIWMDGDIKIVAWIRDLAENSDIGIDN